MTGTIFDIKEFSIHDGPGPRVTVFLKGCPLRCRWCHNPEGLRKEPQLLWKESLCIGCGRCRIPCDHPDCRGLDRCRHQCAKGALTLSGVQWKAEDLAKKLRSFESMLASMGGGITLSGGEPLYQPDFTVELLERLSGMHRAIQTSGYASESVFRQALEHTEYVMMDVKLADPRQHKEYTGVDNGPILRNLRILQESGKPHLLRTPLIPGVTDTAENLRAIAQLAGDSPVELLEYNPFAPAKYAQLGVEFPLGEPGHAHTIDLSVFRNVTVSKL